MDQFTLSPFPGGQVLGVRRSDKHLVKPQMDLFISCAENDHDIALRLCNDLKKIGLIPWLESEDFLPGKHRETQIRQAIEQSKYVLVLLSSHSVSQRGIVQKELKIALDILESIPKDDIFIIPIRLDNCKSADERLQSLSQADFSESYERGLDQLMRVLSPKKHPDLQFRHKIKYKWEARKRLVFILISFSLLLILIYFFGQPILTKRADSNPESSSKHLGIIENKITNNEDHDKDKPKVYEVYDSTPKIYKYTIHENKPQFVQTAQVSISVVFQNISGENYVSLNIAPTGAPLLTRAVLTGYTEEFESSKGIYFIQILNINYESREVSIQLTKKSS